MKRSMHHLRSTLCFLLSLVISAVDSNSKRDCSFSFCGKNKDLPVHYPFQLEGKNDQTQKGCPNPPISLKCSNQNIPILSLPSTGDLHVSSIDYSAKTIRLHDPNGCLPSHLVNASLTSFSPLAPADGQYQNHTLFSCREEAIRGSSFITAIDCLSNSTFSIVAALSGDINDEEMMRLLGCNKTVSTLIIPVHDGGNLILKWDFPACDVCRKKGPVAKEILFWFLGFPVIVTAGSLGLYYAVVLCESLSKRRRDARARARQATRRLPAAATANVAIPQPQAITNNKAAGGSSSSTNNYNCTRIVVGESRRIPGPNSPSCPICLDDYSPGEIVKCISKCKHCFHAMCLDEWLNATHTTCPICRISAR